MPRFSANLAYLFTELPFMERFAAAAAAGFKAVEVQFPYAYPAGEIKKELDATGLTLDLINMPAGNWEDGERGLAVLPGRDEEFRQAVELALEYAVELGVYKINCLCGIAAAGEDESAIMQRVASRLAFASGRLQAAGRSLLVEGINNFDMPGFWLNSIGKARELFGRPGLAALVDLAGLAGQHEQAGRSGPARLYDLAGVAEHAGLSSLSGLSGLPEQPRRPKLFYQFDIYHAARMGEDIAACIRANFDIIGHFQLADAPGREQPGSGDIDFPALFRLVDDLGYAGLIGLEYVPRPDTLGSLGWIAEYGLSL